jgi:hypothetical protein
VVVCTLGRQGRSFYDQSPSLRRQWLDKPWVALYAIKGGAWAAFQPKPVRIAASRFMVYRVRAGRRRGRHSEGDIMVRRTANRRTALCDAENDS